MRGGAEARVGLFTALALAAAVWASMATTDNPFKDQGYTLHTKLVNAQGLKDGSGIELAGVRIGAIERVYVDGNFAIADLSMDGKFTIPMDSSVSVGSRGLLGDTILKVHTGNSATVLSDGDWIKADLPLASIQDIQAELGDIAADVKAITGSLRTMLDTEETVGRVSSILTNVDQFTKDVTGITAQNADQIAAVIENMRLLTEQLNTIATSMAPQLDTEMAEIAEVKSGPLPGQLHVFGGSDDPLAPPERLSDWSEFSTVKPTYQVFEGDHMFIQGAAKLEVIAAVDTLIDEQMQAGV